MNMATRLIADALLSLDSEDVAESLWGTANGVVRFCNAVKNRSIRRTLEPYYEFSPPEHLDAYTLPDAVWSAICLKQPHLYCYPLGEIAERAAKKMLAFLVLCPETDEAVPETDRVVGEKPPLDERETHSRLRHSIEARRTEGLLRLFISHYFFELAIDYLRRPTKSPRLDFSYWYNFSDAGSLVSLAAERKLRQTLAKQCEKKATAFLPFLRKSLRKRKPDRIEQLIAEGLEQIFEVPARNQKESQEPDKPFLNVIVGRKQLRYLRRSYTVGEKPVWLLLYPKDANTKDANVSFHFDKLKRFLKSQREEKRDQLVHSLVKDLLDIAVAVYMSDRYAKREPHLGRRMGILIPVRHLAIWSKDEASTELERAVSFLARDDFRIHFVKHEEHADRDRRFRRETEKKDRCVCLLSGGVDSAAGAVWALEQGLKPVFVSHYASTRLSGTQKAVISQLGKVFATPLQHVGAYVNRARGPGVQQKLGKAPGSIMFQHLRSFLFLSLATVVALELGIRKVYIFENGPLALNPLFSEARVNTRTVHPHFLVLFRRLIKAVFGVDLEIENPFAYYTKGEVAECLARSELRGLVSKTESCWYTFRVQVRADEMDREFSERHDGDCLSCIIRRTSVYHADLWDEDTDYLVNIFDEFPDLPRYTVTGIADFLRFCQAVKMLSDAELLLRAPDFSVCAEGADPRELIAMYRRHSEEVVACFRDKSNRPFQERFASILGT